MNYEEEEKSEVYGGWLSFCNSQLACFPSAPEEEGRGDGMKDLKVGKNHRRHINTDRGALTGVRAGIKTMKESSDSLLALSKEEEKER